MAKTKNPPVPGHLWDADAAPPHLRDVLSQAAHFFDQLGYTNTFNALLAEARENGVIPDIAEWERGLGDGTSSTLMQLWEAWRESEDGYPTLPASGSPVKKSSKAKTVDVEMESGDEDKSDEESSEDEEDETEGKKAGIVDDEAESTSDDSSEEDSSDASSSDEEEAQVGTKRKRVMTPESSSEEESSDESSDASSSESSDDKDARPAKRAKTAATDDSSEASSSDSSSDDDSSSALEAEGGVDVEGDSSSGSSSESSDSGSDSSSEDSSSESEDSSSSSDEDGSESESSASPPPKKTTKTTAKTAKTAKDANDSASSSSATLTGSPTKTKADELLVPAAAVDDSDPTAGMHPDRLKRMPATKENVEQLKKASVPFSRIPADTVVDPKFASNNYVPYEYADKAYQDLSVTKGKGFTKEKNKKKRGAYRGGAIDFTPKGIKFDD